MKNKSGRWWVKFFLKKEKEIKDILRSLNRTN
jgi:hypothetical protein